ncbi:YopX family protein [Staphylococcus saprophyticus]|uniref:YopX family protein n=1 Tax=Staphylococcus saprophyticus TaxID=29385 RepID=UPI002DBFC5BC|nr:YopX family protein [Staphylococcus saprophyticus]MEB8335780.1 YopX family protein [Staphylococcus saprophyticus]
MIKFRAWDKVEKEWLSIRTIGFDDDGSLWYLQAWDDNENDIDPPYLVDDLGVKWELSQSTGLKDKNGVEIFENNIVNVHEFINVGGIEGYKEGEKETIGIIKYGCLYDSPIPEWYLKTKDDCVSFSYMDLHEESFEVIGNKFEHPNLLKE